MAVTEPFRLRVLQALTASLSSISKADGYAFDLAGAVFRGRSLFGDSHPDTLISILESPRQRDPGFSPVDCATGEFAWELLVQGFTLDDKKNPTDPAQRLLADVRRKLAEEKERRKDRRTTDVFELGPARGLKNSIQAMRIGAGTVGPADGVVSSNAFFWLPVTFEIVEDLSAPFE